jgi:phage shock protein A
MPFRAYSWPGGLFPTFVHFLETGPIPPRRRVKELPVDHSSHTLLQAGSQTAISARMRELLARAAQDYVYEQRTQGDVLDEIRQRLEGMEWLLREVRERELGGLSGAVETVAGRLDDLIARPPAWAEDLGRHVEALRERVDAAGTHAQDLTGQVTALGQRLGQVRAGMEAAAVRFTRLDKAVAELAQRVERMEGAVIERLGAVDERVDAVSERVGELGGRVRGLAAELDISGLRAAVAELGSDMTAAASSIAPLLDAIRSRPDRDELAETVSGATSRVVEPVHADVDRRLAALEETMLALAEALLRPARSSAD